MPPYTKTSKDCSRNYLRKIIIGLRLLASIPTALLSSLFFALGAMLAQITLIILGTSHEEDKQMSLPLNNNNPWIKSKSKGQHHD